MTERSRTPRGALVLAVLAAALAAFAAARALEGTSRAILRADTEAPAFWIGAWVGPPVADLEPTTWRRLADAGIDVSMGPLEDRYRRADNVARLAFLDTTRTLAANPVRTFVRDDSLHPDETRRPGWEARVAAIVKAYGGARALAGYFLADEPRPGDVATWAPLSRLLRRLDPAHPAFVNFVGVAPEDASDAAARERWRTAMTRSIGEGELALFTVDAYPFGTEGGERPHFLATLAEAAAVSRRTGRPFGVVLQWTGHGGLRTARAGEARYQAMEALAHGASCVIWFTYWTPNPNEEPWRWHDGAVAYDGAPTARLDTLTWLNAEVRGVAGARGPAPLMVAHVGGGLPVGLLDQSPAAVPGIASIAGGPCSIGFTAPDSAGGPALYVLVNRDREQSRPFTLRFAVAPGGAAPDWNGTLAPGGAAVIRGLSAPPHTPSPPGTR